MAEDNSEVSAGGVTSGAVHPDSSAPPLTYLSISYTCGQATSSSTLICENDANACSTTSTYPTSDYKIYEVVVTHGYGTNIIAKLGGSTGYVLPMSAMVETDMLCGSTYTTCPVGGVATGFRYWFDITSYLDSGYARQFYVQATGTNNPGTTLSAQLTIM